MLTGVIFCDSDNFVARAIKDITHEPDSHVALLFDDNIVLHFRFIGFETLHVDEFVSLYHISDVLQPRQHLMVSPGAVISKYKGRAYDFRGLIYAGLFLLCRDLFGFYLPGGNKLERKRDRFCVEFVSEICLAESGSLMTPGQLKDRLLQNNYTRSNVLSVRKDTPV